MITSIYYYVCCLFFKHIVTYLILEQCYRTKAA